MSPCLYEERKTRKNETLLQQLPCEVVGPVSGGGSVALPFAQAWRLSSGRLRLAISYQSLPTYPAYQAQKLLIRPL
jgi:hypothetical protein